MPCAASPTRAKKGHVFRLTDLGVFFTLRTSVFCSLVRVLFPTQRSSPWLDVVVGVIPVRARANSVRSGPTSWVAWEVSVASRSHGG